MLTSIRLKQLFLVWLPALFILLYTGRGVSACPCCHTCAGCETVFHKHSHSLQTCCSDTQCTCKDGKSQTSKPSQSICVTDRHSSVLSWNENVLFTSQIALKIIKRPVLSVENYLFTTSVPPRAPPVK